MTITDHRRTPITRTNDPDRRTAMYAAGELRLYIVQAIRQGDLAAAAERRRLRAHRARASRPVRARIGRSIIRIGERLASEAPLEPVRPR
jgi:hypothetical protein